MKQIIKNLTFVVVYVLLLFSCSQASKQVLSDDINITINVDPSNALEHIKVSDIFSDIVYVPLETNDNSLIGNISEIMKYKNRFYIMDNEITHSVFCFTEAGEFLFKINRIGTGPGEYTNLAAFTIDYNNEQLLIYDNSARKVLHFSLNGDYIESHPIGFHSYRFAYISNGHFAFYNDFTMSNKELLYKGKYPNLIITDTKFNIINTGMNYSKDANFSAIPMLPQCFNRFDPKTISLISPLNDTIFHVSDSNIFPHLHFKFKNNQREKDIQKLMNEPEIEIDGIINFVKDNSICDIFYFVESTQMVFFIYSRSTDVHYAFYDKISGTLKDIVFNAGKSFPIINDMDGSDFAMPIMSEGNLFFGIVSPSELFDQKEDITSSDTPNKQRIIELFKQVSEDDNPIIAIISPKNNQLNE